MSNVHDEFIKSLRGKLRDIRNSTGASHSDMLQALSEDLRCMGK